jgi:hypothetical protein
MSKLGFTRIATPFFRFRLGNLFFQAEAFFLGASKRLYNSLHWLVAWSVGWFVPILLLPVKSRAWFVIQLVLSIWARLLRVGLAEHW